VRGCFARRTRGAQAAARRHRTGQRNNISVSVCGFEMAGEPLLYSFALGLGLTTFSMNGPDIPRWKKIKSAFTTYEHAKQVARKVIAAAVSGRSCTTCERKRVIIPEAF